MIFTWVPDYGSPEQHRPRVRVAQFGDGYQQRSADGINTDAATWTLTFSNRADGEASAIKTFLAARAGLESFDWTPPGGLAALKWVCSTWQATPANFGATTITATFTQVFEA